MAEFKDKLRALGADIKSYFNLSDELEPQADAMATIIGGVSFKGSQLLVLIFAIFIASLGLNTNSIPVIIGAMLISPLMGPIIGMGVAIGISDFVLLKRGLKNIAMAIIGSLLASALYFLISPQYEGASQLLARTSPSIYDVLVALFGGAAGILSIACKNKGQVMPGVAIATSLMPPLCTAGYGLATLQPHFFFGAFYLFFTNMIFILFASWIGVKLFGYKRIVYQDKKRARRVQRAVTVIVVATVILSCCLTFRMIQTNIFLSEATEFVENEMTFPNTQVLNHREYVSGGKRYIDVTLIGERLPMDSLKLAMMNKLDSVGLGGTVLNIKQGFSIGERQIENDHDFDKFYAVMQMQISSKEELIDSLRREIASHPGIGSESVEIAPEIKVLFPTVEDIAVSRMVATQTLDTRTQGKALKDTLNMIFVNAPRGLSVADRKKLEKYVALRMELSNLHLTLNPTDFPWPSSARPHSAGH